MRTVFAVMALTSALGMNAKAEEFGAGSLFAGPNQFWAVCYFFNQSVATVGLSDPQISSPAGTPLRLVVNECPTVLPAGRSCGIAANVSTNLPYNCRVDASSVRSRLRGVFELLDRSGKTLASVEMR
jgi:hypothetical protein